MTWLIAIDESGNLGSNSRFFVMSAIIIKRVRNLNHVFKVIPRYREESKFYNSTDCEIKKVLRELASVDIIIATIEVDKYDYASVHYGKYGNELYFQVLSMLLDKVFKLIGEHDVNMFIDRSTFISLNKLCSLVVTISSKNGCNVKHCEKVTSHQNMCVQIADYVAGAIYYYLQHKDSVYKSIIEKKILCP